MLRVLRNHACEKYHLCLGKPLTCVASLKVKRALYLSYTELLICIPLEVDEANGVRYEVYESELQMPDIMRLIQKDLSEPYSVYTYRYFIHNWPHLCLMVSTIKVL